ncbi:amino acid permease [Saccharibacter floricola]|uniref:L-asparagine permease n=1 Tax=Saccharibacter floricola DSM 15669 TaxID=1123227 RepID=A0ABQ0NYJ8_9PROT|nr:amino acid permease [Saccharibacter floricola]GBQ06635.1 L-asparagine permease [Saccharibacter floricola DSM 15669]
MTISPDDQETLQERAVDDGHHRVSNEGYQKDLSQRHVQMIAIGGAIGTGLFLGAGSRLQIAGPSLAISYAICGLCAFMILRAMGELVMYRPSSGSFVTYAREFLGEGAAYAAGWFFFLNWAMTGIVDITAIALYIHYWPVFGGVPQWILALGALVVVGAVNLTGVRYFGEIEFWFSLIKVLTLVVFLAVGGFVLFSGTHVGGYTPGLHLITQSGGLFPHGMVASLMLIQGVVFAYAATELIGVAAGECHDAKSVVPRAINSVIWRIILFYVGSIVLLVLVLPWSSYHEGESPFVTFFSRLGLPGADSIMNFVVLTAALSSLNSGLYSTGRILRALSLGGSAPGAMSKMNRHAVPYVAIGTTLVIYLIGVLLNYFYPTQVFEIVLSISSLGILGTWACIVMCQLKLHKAIRLGKVAPTGFAMPFAPYSGWLTLAFLALVLVMMAFDYPSGTISVACIPLLALIFFAGWFLLKRTGKQPGTVSDEK